MKEDEKVGVDFVGGVTIKEICSTVRFDCCVWGYYVFEFDGKIDAVGIFLRFAACGAVVILSSSYVVDWTDRLP